MEEMQLSYAYQSKYQKRISYLVYGTKDYMLTYPFKLLYNCFKLKS